MLTAAWTRITAVILITVLASGCGGGGGGGGSVGPGSGSVGITTPPTQNIAATPTQASTPAGAPPATAASLWLGNVTQLGVSAYVSQAAPTDDFGAWVITNVTVPTTYYLRGTYTNNGIASIQASPAAEAIAFNITFKSPASLGVGIYTDTITMEGCYDSGCSQQLQNSPMTIKITYVVKADPVTLTSISPSGVVAGSPGFTLTLTGTKFSKDSVVIFNTFPQPTTYISPTQITANIAADMLVTPEEGPVTVESSTQDNADVSAPVTLHVLAPAPDPTVSGLAPSSAIVGSPDFTLTVNGANFTIA